VSQKKGARVQLGLDRRRQNTTHHEPESGYICTKPFESAICTSPLVNIPRFYSHCIPAFSTMASNQHRAIRVRRCSSLTKLQIGAGQLTTIYTMRDIRRSIEEEAQSGLWYECLPHLMDFVRIKTRGIQVTCASRRVAQRLDGSTVWIYGQEFVIFRQRPVDKMYFMNIQHAPHPLVIDTVPDPTDTTNPAHRVIRFTYLENGFPNDAAATTLV
jgi:hypothetical protein